MPDDLLAGKLREIARRAGKEILQVYQQKDLSIERKQDATPVTVADLRANAVIVQALSELDDIYPILSEESDHSPYSERQHWHRYWLVDPLDGTQEFINGNGQFAVNIALMEGHYPIFGMVHVPVTDTSYWGGKSLGAFKQVGGGDITAIRPRSLNAEEEVIVLSSRSYATPQAAYLEKLKEFYPGLELRPVGSSLKSCHIAEGLADLYPRLGPTSEWDTAAPQAVVEGAGGMLVNAAGERFLYNTGESLKNPDFLVLADPEQDWRAFWNTELLNSFQALPGEKCQKL